MSPVVRGDFLAVQPEITRNVHSIVNMSTTRCLEVRRYHDFACNRGVLCHGFVTKLVANTDGEF